MSIEVNPSNTGSEANGTTAERQFDALLRLTNLVNRADAGVLSSFALTLDDADQRTQVIREDGKVYTYANDATGNPVDQRKNGLVYTNSFNNLNQIVTGSLTGATVTVVGSVNYSAGSNCVRNISGKTRKRFHGKVISKQTNTKEEKQGPTKMKQCSTTITKWTVDHGAQKDRDECR